MKSTTMMHIVFDGGQKNIQDKEYEGLPSVVNDGIKAKFEALTALIFIEITQ